MKRTLPWLLCALVLFACSEDDGTEPPPPGNGGGNGDSTLTGYNLVNAFPNLTFARPTDITHAGDGTNRVFVTEQNGFIRVFANNSGVGAATTFLDISGPVQSPTNSEMGLLGLAFHPNYESNGYFYVSYTAGDSSNRLGRVSRFTVTGDPNVADPGSEAILLEFQDDYGNHNGGGLCFGDDGYLYIAIGDEGDAGDPNDNAQDRSRIFGKILRVDVDQNVNTIPYHGIPASNPYVGNGSGWREDIFAYGLRNPWRISYDSESDRLMTGDVGQSAQEEIDIIVSGGNYGWDCREGTVAYDEDEDPMSPLCPGTNMIEPIFVYGRSQGGSITGGYIYRGPTATSLTGKYVYADYLTGRVWALDVVALTNDVVRDSSLFISTFGEAQNQELLVAGYAGDGTPTALYRIVEIWEKE